MKNQDFAFHEIEPVRTDGKKWFPDVSELQMIL